MTLALLLPILKAAGGGLVGSILLDLAVFMRTKEPGEFMSQWNYKVALWRWAQGIVGGICGYFGLAIGG